MFLRQKSSIKILVGLGLFFSFLFGSFSFCRGEEIAPPAFDYAPNFWFSGDEDYFPVNPLDFYFENGEEVAGEIALAKYNALSSREKLSRMMVLYHVDDNGQEWVYEYWLFYVFNDYEEGVANKHYGDWESVFVFVDKNTKKINKAIGSAHQREIWDTDLYNPQTNHIWAYVADGSHASCVEFDDIGECGVSRWHFIERWEKDGRKVSFNNYGLRQIDSGFISFFDGNQSFTKSPDIINNLFGVETTLGGTPPTHAWNQEVWDEPNKAQPIFSRRSLTEGVKKTANQVVNAAKEGISKIASLFQSSDKKQTSSSAPGNSLPASEGITGDKSNELKSNGPKNSSTVKTAEDNKKKAAVSEEKKKNSSSADKKDQSGGNSGGAKENSLPVDQKNQNTGGSVQNAKPKSSSISPGAGHRGASGGGNAGNSSSASQDGDKGKDDDEKDKIVLPPAVVSPQSEIILGPNDDLDAITDDLQVNLMGTSTALYSILISVGDEDEYQAVADEEGDWNQTITLEDGTNSIKLKAENEKKKKSEEIEVVLEVDLLVPDAVSDLTAEAGDNRGEIELSWTVPKDSHLKSYQIKQATSSPINEENWDLLEEVENILIPLAAGFMETLTVSGLDIDLLYYFALRSADETGSWSEISNEDDSLACALADSVVIDEIVINGEGFVELFNPTENAVDLEGWQLAYYGRNNDWPSPAAYYEFLEGASIAASGRYLIALAGWPERNDNFVVPDRKITGLQPNALSGSLALFENDSFFGTSSAVAASMAVDAVGWGEAKYVYENEPVEASVSGYSLTRSGGEDINDNSRDFTSDDWPTPTNSSGEIMTIIADNIEIEGEETWAKSNSPYILTSNKNAFPTVKDEAILTIEPGVTVVMNNNYPGLLVEGTLEARGTADNPIIFTGMEEEASDWAGIVFDDSQNSVLDYVKFDKGGNSGYYKARTDLTAMLKATDSQLAISNSWFENSSHDGIFLSNSEVTISNSVFDNNSQSGIAIEGGENISISDCQFEDNDIGLEISAGAKGEAEDNIFSGNAETAIQAKSAYLSFDNNQAENNGVNGISIHWESLFGLDFEWGGNLPYVLFSSSGAYPTVNNGVVMTIASGTIIKAASQFYSALAVEGELTARGTADNPIIFTSLKDDAFGGDTNNDGLSEGKAGDWKNIKFEENGRGYFDYTDFYNGASSYFDIGEGAEVETTTNCFWD